MAVLECGKREKMAQMVAAGESQADAYRAAFNSTGVPNTVHVNASKIMAETKVKLRVTEIKEELAEKALWTREDSVRVLSEIARGVDEEAKPNDRVNAVKAINQMHGYDAPIKVDNRHKVIDDGSNEW